MANLTTVSLQQFSSIPAGAICRGSNAFEYEDVKISDKPYVKEKLLEKDDKGGVTFKKTGYTEDKTAVKPPKTKDPK
jgi:hypothetical protein